MKIILLCSDLDRTLIPNGEQPESPGARELFSQLASRQEIRLAYVSGRDIQLIKEAIGDYSLPQPDFIIGDVGTTLYRSEGSQWLLDEKWQQLIGRDWRDCSAGDVVELLADIDGINDLALRLQEDERQNRYKVSYYTDSNLQGKTVEARISALLAARRICSTVIWSRDDAEQCGLLDILPRRANKLQAIRFLMEQENIAETNTIFAGDSGNDLDVLTSGLQAILVKNCAADVERAAVEQLEEKDLTEYLYVARGGLNGMNGNYGAGVLEGIVHFFPETAGWFSATR